MRYVPLLLLLVLFTLPTLTAAQTDDDSGWPVIERCVGEPTAPPEGWTFDGTILMTGYAGIHGVNAEWETPRVAVFLRNKDWQNKNMDLPGGALSPDGHWYASPYGERYVTETQNTITLVDEIRIHELFTGKMIVQNWPRAMYTGGTNGQVHWLNNSALVLETLHEGTFILNPLNGELESWTLFDDLFGLYDGQSAFFSPDVTRVIYRADGFDYKWYLVNISDENIVQANLPFPLDNNAIIWASDSTLFFAKVENETSHKIARFDADGLQREVIHSLHVGDRVGSTSFRLSNDDAYLSFVIIEGRPSVFNMVGRLYIADLNEQLIVDTCFDTPRSLSWSPTDRQVALQGNVFSHGTINLLVFDLNQWQVYSVARQINPDNVPDEIIGWRAD